MTSEGKKTYAPAAYWDRTVRSYIDSFGSFGYWGGRLLDNYSDRFDPSARTVLELGCGCGQDAVKLAERGMEVTALDVSAEAIDFATRMFGDSGVKWIVADMAEPLPFGDSEFDMVVTNQAIHMFPHDITVAIFREVRRVVRSGGLFACHLNSVKDRPHRAGYKPVTRELEPNFVLESDGQTMHFFTREYVRDLLAGWSDVRIDEIQDEVRDNGRTFEKWMFCITAVAP